MRSSAIVDLGNCFEGFPAHHFKLMKLGSKPPGSFRPQTIRRNVTIPKTTDTQGLPNIRLQKRLNLVGQAGAHLLKIDHLIQWPRFQSDVLTAWRSRAAAMSLERIWYWLTGTPWETISFTSIPGHLQKPINSVPASSVSVIICSGELSSSLSSTPSAYRSRPRASFNPACSWAL